MAMHPDDQHKTAFRALGSLYEFTRLPFGVCNGPASFSRLMGKCLGDLNYEFLILYLDDILVFSETIDGMLDRLEVVFGRLRNFGLKLKPSKCHFFKKKVSYLGHVVYKAGVETCPEKVKAVSEWRIPESAGELHSFVGLVGFYRKYIKDFSRIAEPLLDLLTLCSYTKKKKKKPTPAELAKFHDNWNDQCLHAFKALKEKLISAPILGYPDFSLPFILEIDASLKGLGAILPQNQSPVSPTWVYLLRAGRFRYPGR